MTRLNMLPRWSTRSSQAGQLLAYGVPAQAQPAQPAQRADRVRPQPPPPAAGGAAGAAVEGGFLQFAEGVRILPDERTNSLLVMATKEDMARIEQLIKEVDTSVAQVQIEVVIAEVTLNNELDVGVDVFKRLFNTRSVSQTGGNITDGNPPVQLAPLSAIYQQSSELRRRWRQVRAVSRTSPRFGI